MAPSRFSKYVAFTICAIGYSIKSEKRIFVLVSYYKKSFRVMHPNSHFTYLKSCLKI